jgi:hypothetical protein
MERPAAVTRARPGEIIMDAASLLGQPLTLTVRYCVVHQTIRNGSPVDVTMQRG